MKFGETVLLIILGTITIGGAILMRGDIVEWFKRQHWNLLFWINDNECPFCHRRFVHKADVKGCRCRFTANHEDDRGIGAQAPWEKFHGGSAWPRL